MSFVFYDTETTGVHKAFDQVLQFAAIRTDAELNELDRFEIRCRINPHIVPSPGALRVTKIDISQITDPDLPSHYDMVCRIVEKLASWSPAVFVGWNTMDFDEHLLRQALYQCLHRPYLTNSGGNCRADVLKIAQVASVMEPGAIVVPRSFDGKPVFKLDRLAPANGFAHLNAHDALADVEATIHVARLLKDGAPDTWSNAVRFSKKASVVDFIEEEPAVLLTEFYFNRPFQFVVSKIGADPENSAVTLGLDLAADISALAALTDRELISALQRSPKPIRRIRTNACPSIQDVPFGGWRGRSASDLYAQAERIRSDTALCERLVRAFLAGQSPFEVTGHVEDQIYAGFSGDADNRLMDEFHELPWGHRMRVVGRFEDRRLAELGRRLIFINSPEALPIELREIEARALACRLTGHSHLDPPWVTISKATAEARAELVGCDAEERRIMDGLCAYLERQLQHANAVLGL